MIQHLKHVKTYFRLGVLNVVRVIIYRFSIKNGLHKVQKITAKKTRKPFFRRHTGPYRELAQADKFEGILQWFGWYEKTICDKPPNWFENPFSITETNDATIDWWRIPDFGPNDIKGLWELSRMDWVVSLAKAAAGGDNISLNRLNDWLENWSENNPPYTGPNWKCGQEASIRVINLVVASCILGQDQSPELGLIELLRAHLQRIEPTMSYAIGQQNNHGTSEAAALFIGGSFLARYDHRADAWSRKGRKWLEERAVSLIEPDGSFSQYSVNYHRLMLDTYSIAEIWRERNHLTEFSDSLKHRLAAATEWLWAITDTSSGDAPNIGANDGAWLLRVAGLDYRDFRPSVQMAAALFLGLDAFGSGPWRRPLEWFEVAEGQRFSDLRSRSFDQGGYHVLRNSSTLVVLRYPRFRFRPGHSDALHVDLWHKGVNLLRDAGTFSYNSPGSEWFAGTAAHNTIEFDGRDQMPRLGRFLFGDWLGSEKVMPVCDMSGIIHAAAGYKDARGNRHHRSLKLRIDGLICEDNISGSFNCACLRWRLPVGEWYIEEDIIRNGQQSISIEFDGAPVTPSIGSTFESRYYFQKTEVLEVSVTVKRPGKIVTKVNF